MRRCFGHGSSLYFLVGVTCHRLSPVISLQGGTHSANAKTDDTGALCPFHGKVNGGEMGSYPRGDDRSNVGGGAPLHEPIGIDIHGDPSG
jgi:hypothetical protein